MQGRIVTQIYSFPEDATWLVNTSDVEFTYSHEASSCLTNLCLNSICRTFYTSVTWSDGGPKQNGHNDKKYWQPNILCKFLACLPIYDAGKPTSSWLKDSYKT